MAEDKEGTEQDVPTKRRGRPSKYAGDARQRGLAALHAYRKRQGSMLVQTAKSQGTRQAISGREPFSTQLRGDLKAKLKLKAQQSGLSVCQLLELLIEQHL